MDKILAWLLETLGLRQPIHYIGGSDTLPPPLSREREAELLARLGEEPARQELIEHNLRLVVVMLCWRRPTLTRSIILKKIIH